MSFLGNEGNSAQFESLATCKIATTFSAFKMGKGFVCDFLIDDIIGNKATDEQIKKALIHANQQFGLKLRELVAKESKLW